jgi:hypothetical protein
MAEQLQPASFTQQAMLKMLTFVDSIGPVWLLGLA